MLYGPDGRPLPPPPARELTRRAAQPTHTGWRRAQQWRSVVTTLEPARLRNIYHALAQGTWTPDFFELSEEIEERDLHYRGVLQQRKLKAAGAALEVVAASDDDADQEIAADVREQVLQGPGFHGLLIELLDALGKGVACVEIVWRRDGSRRWLPAHYYRIDPRWLVFRDDDGETPLLMRDRRVHVRFVVRRAKAPFLSGCESRPATVVPAGSSRSGRWRQRHRLKHSDDTGRHWAAQRPCGRAPG